MAGCRTQVTGWDVCLLWVSPLSVFDTGGVIYGLYAYCSCSELSFRVHDHWWLSPSSASALSSFTGVAVLAAVDALFALLSSWDTVYALGTQCVGLEQWIWLVCHILYASLTVWQTLGRICFVRFCLRWAIVPSYMPLQLMHWYTWHWQCVYRFGCFCRAWHCFVDSFGLCYTHLWAAIALWHCG